MQIPYHKYIKTFLLALALVVLGTMHVGPVAFGETAPQDNVTLFASRFMGEVRTAMATKK